MSGYFEERAHEAEVRLLRRISRSAIPDHGADSLHELTDWLMDSLTHREQIVLRERFGLSGGQKRTLRAIGGDLGLTGERIRQIQQKALLKLLHPSRRRRVEAFLKRRGFVCVLEHE